MKKHLILLFFLCTYFLTHAQTVSITSSATGAICAGTSVTFTATPSGYTTPTYQWYKNNVAISGATSSTYVTSDLVNNNAIHVIAVEGGASVSETGLVLNLDAGNSSSYTSGATTWTDLTGKGNHGTLNNVTYSSSNQGYLSFNGTTSYVSLPNSTDFNFGTGDFTIELWAQNSSASTTPNLLAINSNNSFYSAVRIGWNPNINGNPTMTFNHSTTGSSWSVQTGYTGSFSNWTQIVISRTAGVVTMYANGVNKGTYNLAGSLMTTTTSNPINNQIGTLPNYQSIYTLLGNMSIVRYYKAAGLTSSQVISNYNAICSRYGLNTIGTTSNAITSSITAGPSLSITLSGDGCVNKSSLSATTGLSSYAWYKDDAMISGATTNTYTPSIAGAYKVTASNGTCSSTSAVTTINTCGVTSDGKMMPTAFSAPLVSSEGGANFGTTIDEVGKILNTTGLTTTTGTIAATTAVLGGIISATNAVTSSIGVIYSTDANFGTYSSSTIQSNVAAGTYTTTITGLTSETTYYTKSFVVNKAGTSYGPVVSFNTPAAFSAPNIVTNGLLLNLDAANPASYTGTGTTWTNLATAGRSVVPNFTINNSATYISVDGAIRLSAGGSPVASTTSSFGLLTSFTIEVWVKSNNLSGCFFTERIRHPITNSYGNPIAVNMMLEYGIDNNYGAELQGGIGTTDRIGAGFYPNGWRTLQTTSSDASIIGTWTHIIATFDASSKILKLYKNGSQLISSTAYGTIPTSSNFGYYIGAGWEGGTKFGDYSIVNLYNRALSQTEITTNYDAVKARFGL